MERLLLWFLEGLAEVRQPAGTAGGLRPALTLHNIQKQQRTASNRDTVRRKGALVSRL